MAQAALQAPEGYDFVPDAAPQAQVNTPTQGSQLKPPDGYDFVPDAPDNSIGSIAKRMISPIAKAAANYTTDEPDAPQNAGGRIMDTLKGAGSGLGQAAVGAVTGSVDAGRALATGIGRDFSNRYLGGQNQDGEKIFDTDGPSLTGSVIDATGLNYNPTTAEGKRAQLVGQVAPGIALGAKVAPTAAAGDAEEQTASMFGNANKAYSDAADPKIGAKAADIVDSFLASDKTTKADVAAKVAANQSLGLPQTPIDAVTKTINGRTVAGRNILSLARASVATPNADSTLSEALANREATEGDRVAGHLDTHLSNNSFYDELAKNQQAMADNGVNYDAAYADPTPINTRPVQLAIRTPAGRAALAAADKMAQNEGATIFAENSTPKNPILNTQGADYFKRALDDQIASARQVGSKQAAASMQQIKNTVTEEADKANPAFAVARQGHLTPARQTEMMENGRAFNTQDPEEVAATVHGDTTTPAEKDAYLTGVRRNLKDSMSAGSDKSSPVNRIWKAATRERLEAAMPTEDYAALTGKMAEEQNMRNNSDYILKGSQTAETTAAQNAIKEASGNSGLGKKAVVAVRSALSPKYEAAKLGAEFLSQGLQKKIGGMTPEVASEIQKILANPNHPYWSMQ